MKSWQLILVSVSCCLGDGVFDRIYDDIFYDRRYNPDVIPMRNPEEPLKVNVQLSLLDLDMDRKGSPLEANVWMALEWEDYRLSWDPAQYQGLKQFNVPAKRLWTPDMQILNSHNFDTESFSARMENKPGRAVLSSNGTIIWYPSNLIEVHCEEASPLDKEEEERRCSISVGSWTHMDKEIQIDGYKGHDFISLEDFKKGSEFVVTSQKGGALTTEKYDEWGNYSFFKYEFKLIKSYVKDPQGNYVVNPKLQSSLQDIYAAYKAKHNLVSGWTD